MVAVPGAAAGGGSGVTPSSISEVIPGGAHLFAVLRHASPASSRALARIQFFSSIKTEPDFLSLAVLPPGANNFLEREVSEEAEVRNI